MHRGANDSKQLTRIFRGCKVVEYELSSTVDAELRYRCIFDALSTYTDTGRLETSNKGDRYIAHRINSKTLQPMRHQERHQVLQVVQRNRLRSTTAV